MQAEEIEKYLSELGQDLRSRGIHKPLHILMIGGAYMLLLMHAPRSTDDVDFFWLEQVEETPEHAIEALREGIQTIAEKNRLDSDWFNYMTHLLMYDQVVIPKGKLWKRFGPLHIHIPTNEYMLALKIVAGRDKDIRDGRILLQHMHVKTQQQARALLHRYILPLILERNAEEIESTLDELFAEE